MDRWAEEAYIDSIMACSLLSISSENAYVQSGHTFRLLHLAYKVFTTVKRFILWLYFSVRHGTENCLLGTCGKFQVPIYLYNFPSYHH